MKQPLNMAAPAQPKTPLEAMKEKIIQAFNAGNRERSVLYLRALAPERDAELVDQAIKALCAEMALVREGLKSYGLSGSCVMTYRLPWDSEVQDHKRRLERAARLAEEEKKRLTDNERRRLARKKHSNT